MISTHFIEVKMNLEKLKEKLIPFLREKEIEIYVETMDLDELEKIHLAYINALSDDDIDDDYFLELSSVGAERPLKTKDDLNRFTGYYIHLASPKYKGYGTLISFQDDIIILEINDKGKMKNIEIKFDDASKMRTAIKL